MATSTPSAIRFTRCTPLLALAVTAAACDDMETLPGFDDFTGAGDGRSAEADELRRLRAIVELRAIPACYGVGHGPIFFDLAA